MSEKANALLVHGAWTDASLLGQVIPLLQAKGLDVIAAQLSRLSP